MDWTNFNKKELIFATYITIFENHLLKRFITLAKIIRSNQTGSRFLCIDIENQNEIINYIKQDKRHQKKFQYINNIILQELVNKDLYDKEEIDNKSKGVTAMKFFKGQENDRTLIIIMSVLLEKKKNQKVKQREKNAIHKVGGYDYEIEE